MKRNWWRNGEYNLARSNGEEIVEIDCFFLEKIFLCLIFIIFLVIAFNYYFIKK